MLTRRWITLQDHALIADAAGDPLTVEILQQWNGMFASDAEEVLEISHVELRGLCLLRGDLPAQRVECIAVKDQLIAKLYQHAIAQQ